MVSQSLIRLFSYCTFQLVRNHSADLSPSSSLADYLILTQSNPLLFGNMEATNLVNSSQKPHENDHQNKGSRVWQSLKARFRSIRYFTCHILLVDFDTVSQDWNMNKTRKSVIMERLLKGIGQILETPNFIIFQESILSLHYVSDFKHIFHTHSVRSPVIWLSLLESFLFCSTCPSQFTPLFPEQLETWRDCSRTGRRFMEIFILPQLFTYPQDQELQRQSASQTRAGWTRITIFVCT